MPQFSDASKAKLATCHPDLQKLFNEVIKHYDCTILEGHRSDAKQEEVFKNGRSTLKAGKSKHNVKPALAVDVAPYPIDWKNTDRFYHFVGFVRGVAKMMDIKIRVGADWNGDNNLKNQVFFDLPHYELLGEKK